jgi:2-polyprenyl-3-methyl-5-hydroxy-6-metoxy-1,4-benzoquinol methylase
MSENEEAFESYFKKFGHISSIREWIKLHDAPEVISIYAHNRIKDFIIDNIEKGGSLLDVGCGYGFLFQRLTFRGAKYEGLYGTEISRSLTKSTKLNAPESEVLVSRAEDLPFIDNVFDNVVCSEVIEHVSDPYAVIQELSRVAKIGGKVILTTPNYFALRFGIDRFLQKLGLIKIDDDTLAVRDNPIPEKDLKRYVSNSNLILFKLEFLSPIPEVRYLKKVPDGVVRFFISSTRFIEKTPVIKKIFCNQLVFVTVKQE